MNINIRVQQLSHEIRNFEADDKIPAAYSDKRRSTYLKHLNHGMHQYKIESIKKLALDKKIKHDVQVIKLQDFLKEAAMIVDNEGNVIAIEQPVGVLKLNSDIRIFKVLPESSTVKPGQSYWSFLDHIGDRVFVLNASHKQNIKFEIFSDREEQGRFYDMIATGFENYSKRRRQNGSILD